TSEGPVLEGPSPPAETSARCLFGGPENSCPQMPKAVRVNSKGPSPQAHLERERGMGEDRRERERERERERGGGGERRGRERERERERWERREEREREREREREKMNSFRHLHGSAGGSYMTLERIC